MIQWGVSAMSHDAALAVFDGNDILYASHSERYSRIKNDKDLHQLQINEALTYGPPEKIYFYENPLLKKSRQLSAGQYKLLLKQSPSAYLKQFGITAPVSMVNHHRSHAAYGLYTSVLVDADILVIDSIGEWDTMSIWRGKNGILDKVWSQKYPHSVGLWYSAMTQRLGLKPQEHEYILMGMAALGDAGRFYQLIKDDFFDKLPDVNDPATLFKQNLHRGCLNWQPELTSIQDYVDIAAAVQRIYEEILLGVLGYMSKQSSAFQLVIVGGCALNCVANTLAYNFYDKVWVPPNPGDAGSSVGAILANHNKHIDLNSAFLGTDIPGDYPIQEILADLHKHGVAAVASGRAEFGPRALGNRSILADPRIPDIKDRVNKIKQREEFRPFSPMILKEHAPQYFKLPDVEWEAPYMQYAIPCIYPEKFPGIVHIDGTSRVQTIAKQTPYLTRGPRRLLEAWHGQTGCPMLLNTSLNVKGQPLVNTLEDAAQWSDTHGVPVRSPT